MAKQMVNSHPLTLWGGAFLRSMVRVGRVHQRSMPGQLLKPKVDTFIIIHDLLRVIRDQTMSYHDKCLIAASKSAHPVRGWRRSILRGIYHIGLKQPPIVVKYGSLEDDWRAVGQDMRRAMKQAQLGE